MPVYAVVILACFGAIFTLAFGVVSTVVMRREVTGRSAVLYLALGGLWTGAWSGTIQYLPSRAHDIPFGAFLGGIVLAVLHVIFFKARTPRTSS
jgi:hypothetical protein